MANQNTLADLSTTPASNLNLLGQSIRGTAVASTIDSMFQNNAAILAAFYDSLGGTATVSGTNTLAVSITEDWSAYASGLVLAIKTPNANTGAVTLNVTVPTAGALGAKAIRSQGDAALAGGELKANGVYLLRYDSAYNSGAGAWVLLNGAGAIFASAAELSSATVSNKAIAPDVALSSMAFQALADAATIAVDHAAGCNAKVTLAGNRAFGAPSNGKVGWPLNIWVVQDGTGNRVPTWDSAYDFGDYGTPVLSTGANQADLVTFMCLTATKYAFLGIRKRVD